ncbi:laforin-like [Rhinopithecus roxellana]|uniref:laforin-like n=1 Tax=Rhinopithecus roxellana TaxID=61622 RepID=UPI0012372C0B|nr:laforin-like [Rhinopithecus roxellana]
MVARWRGGRAAARRPGVQLSVWLGEGGREEEAAARGGRGGSAEGRGVAERGSLGRGRRRGEEGQPGAPRESQPAAPSAPGWVPGPRRAASLPARLGLLLFHLIPCLSLFGLECRARLRGAPLRQPHPARPPWPTPTRKQRPSSPSGSQGAGDDQ